MMNVRKGRSYMAPLFGEVRTLPALRSPTASSSVIAPDRHNFRENVQAHGFDYVMRNQMGLSMVSQSEILQGQIYARVPQHRPKDIKSYSNRKEDSIQMRTSTYTSGLKTSTIFERRLTEAMLYKRMYEARFRRQSLMNTRVHTSKHKLSAGKRRTMEQEMMIETLYGEGGRHSPVILYEDENAAFFAPDETDRDSETVFPPVAESSTSSKSSTKKSKS